MSKQNALSAKPRPKHYALTYKNPAVKSVAVTGTFCDWAGEGLPLQHNGSGSWKIDLNLPAGRYEYRMLVDGEWSDDPICTERVPNPFGSENCVLRI